jgi:tape measure domain-containing protein
MSVVANVAINVDSRQAVNELNKVQTASEQLNKGFSALKQAALALGAALAVKSIADVGTQSQQTKLQLQSLTQQYGELEKATASVDRIQKVLGVSTIEAREGYSQLYAALRGTGVSVEQLEVLFVGLTKAARLSGAGAAEAQGSLLQLKQAFASGQLSGDELRSVLEAMPALTQAVAKETDKLGLTTNATSADIKRLGGEGKLTSDILFAAARSIALSNTRQLTSSEALGAAYKNLQEKIAEAFGPAIVSTVETFAAAVGALGRFLKNNQESITSVATAIINFAKAVGPLAAGILLVVKAYQAWTIASKALAATQAFIATLTGPKGIALVAAGAIAAAGAYTALDNVLKGTQEELKKQSEESKTASGEFAKIAQTVGELPNKSKAATEANKLFTESIKETLSDIKEQQLSIESQVSSLERGSSINTARLDTERSINDLYGQQLGRAYELAGSAQERLNIAVRIFDQQVQAAQIEYRQALDAVALEQRKLQLQVESQQLKLKEIEAEGQLAILKSKDAQQADEKREQLKQALAAQQQVVSATQEQFSAQQQIAEYQKQSAEAQYQSKVLAAQTALEQKLVSEKVGLSQADAIRLSENLAIGARQSGALATSTDQVAKNANTAAGNFIRVATEADRAADAIIRAANAQQGLSSSQGVSVSGAASGAYWPGGFKAFAKGGVVNKPTLGLIGEGGEAEYIIPESKAAGFAMNYLLGGRGGAAIPRFAEGGVVGTPSVNIQTGPVTQMGGANYVTTQEMGLAVQAGIRQTLDIIRADIGARSAMGLM